MVPDKPRPVPLGVIFLLFLLSGATALVYEVVWLRQLILIFGSTVYATSTILSTFMGGLALGAFLGGRIRLLERISPLKAYGYLEIGIGLYAFLVPTLFKGLSPPLRWVWSVGGDSNFLLLSLAKFLGIALVLLPPTILMGASLPVLARQVAEDERRIGNQVGTLYAINTFGAVLGTFLAGFVFIPNLGSRTTLFSTAVVNILLGIIAVYIGRQAAKISQPELTTESSPSVLKPRVRLALIAFTVSGFVAMMLEVAWTRGLALVFGSSVYAFSLMLIAFLIGLAAGSAMFARVLKNRFHQHPGTLLGILLGIAGILAWATSFLFQYFPRWFAWAHFNLDIAASSSFVLQLAFGLAVMFPATFVLGGVFPTVLQLHARSLGEVASSVGTVYMANTVGTIGGAACAGFFIVPALGVRDTVSWGALAELLAGILVLVFVSTAPIKKRMFWLVPFSVFAVLSFIIQPEWDDLEMNSGVYMSVYDVGAGGSFDEIRSYLRGAEILYLEEGLTASVLVAEQPKFDNNRYLAVNGKVEASSRGDMETQVLCSHLPLLLHPDPNDTLLIGLASGISAGSMGTHDVESIRVLEIEKKMVDAARFFENENYNILEDPRLELSFNDARNELEFSNRTYDVVVSEPSNPWMTIAANLFTEEFFELAASRVKDDGIFLQWIQNYYLPTEDLRSIAAAFHQAFPYVMLFETDGGVDFLMVGSKQPITMDFQQIENRMRDLNVALDLRRIYVRNPWDIFAMLQVGPDQFEDFVAGAARNTDNNARVEFSAPRSIGLQTIEANLERLSQHLTDPYQLIKLPPEMSESEARRDLAVAYAYRRYFDRAYDQANKIENPELKSKVLDYLDNLVSRESSP